MVLAGCERAFTARLRKEIHRNLGAYMTPQVAYMQTLGLETMPLRFERQGATCLELAGRLQTLEGIVSVNYTGLKDNPYYKLSTVQFRHSSNRKACSRGSRQPADAVEGVEAARVCRQPRSP